MKNFYKRTLFKTLILFFIVCTAAQAQTFSVDRAFIAHDPAKAEQLGLPRKIQILSVELYRENILDNLRSRIVYKINDEQLQVESFLELKSTQPNGSLLVNSFLFSSGNYGAGCGPHDFTRTYVSFLLSADATQISGHTIYASHDSTPDYCHSPMLSEELNYSIDD